MARYLNAIYMALLLAGLTAGTAFAATVSFSDSDVTPTLANNQWTWTHILEDTEFTPNLAPGDTINVTDAFLSIHMDITRYNPHEPGGIKLFEVTATGDTLFLATLNYPDSAGTVNDYAWNIDLDSLSNGPAILTALNDKSFPVTILMQVNKGSIDNIDSVLSGNASILTDGTDQQPSTVPEPGTLLLLGSGLIGLGLFGRTRKR
jgi:hypothetical protein